MEIPTEMGGSMGDLAKVTGSFTEMFLRNLQLAAQFNGKMFTAALDQARAAQTYWLGIWRYINDFMNPVWIALGAFSETEKSKLAEDDRPRWHQWEDYLELLRLNLRMGEKGLASGLKAMNHYHAHHLQGVLAAWLNTIFQREGEDLAGYMARQARLMDLVVNAYPKAIRDIAPEYGFHFNNGGYIQVAENDRFYLYQVLPTDFQVEVRERGKPILIIPPYVLGADILAFLPGEHKSYVHCFANQGIPTYIRIVKDIQETPAVQLMTGEEDCLDTRSFCEQIQARHGRPVTLSGYCQGGFTAVINYLSGELDGLVDALITSVAPMDGTRSKGLQDFLNLVPERFKEMGYAVKTLPNGNRVVDGRLMSWVFKLKSLDKENPISVFYRDVKLLEKGLKINKNAAAINYWLQYDITDLPLYICQLSYDSYTIPITPDGTLPVKLFGRALNFTRVKEKGIHWLICAAEKDDLVEKESALAPLDWVDAEVSMFPKGHVAIATSWSLPTSERSLHSCFGDNCRGPVRFQLDLEEELEKADIEKAAPPEPVKPPKPSRSRKPKAKA